MKARLCLVATLLLIAAPAFAQEPPATPGTGAQMPSDAPAPAPEQTAPASDPAAPPMEAPSMDKTDAPAAAPAAPDQQAAAPAEIVVTEFDRVDDAKKIVKPWGLPADAIAEMDVYDANGKKIGEVDEVLQDKNGEIKAVAVGYGGFLGFGAKGAIVTLDQLKLKDGTLITELDEDALSQQPEWTK